MKIRIKIIMTVCLSLTIFSGCKPTEKGYREAYDAAKSKREQTDPDEALLTGGHKLLDQDASNWKVIAGDSLQLQHMNLKPADGGSWPQSGPYRLAVARFKMTTNAKSMLADLNKKHNLKPVIATDGKDTYYMIAGSATYPDSLSNVLITFRKDYPKFQHIGLTSDKPLIIVGR